MMFRLVVIIFRTNKFHVCSFFFPYLFLSLRVAGICLSHHMRTNVSSRRRKTVEKHSTAYLLRLSANPRQCCQSCHASVTHTLTSLSISVPLRRRPRRVASVTLYKIRIRNPTKPLRQTICVSRSIINVFLPPTVSSFFPFFFFLSLGNVCVLFLG